jgi:hypothetical protein
MVKQSFFKNIPRLTTVLQFLSSIFQIMVLVIKCQIIVKQCDEHGDLDYVVLDHGLCHIHFHFNQTMINQ